MSLKTVLARLRDARRAILAKDLGDAADILEGAIAVLTPYAASPEVSPKTRPREPTPPDGWPAFLAAVMRHANAVTGRDYCCHPVGQAYQRLMKARARELYVEAKSKNGNGVTPWRRVFVQMCCVWDEKMLQSEEGDLGRVTFDRRFVRPETLYTGKLHTYVQEARDRAIKVGGVPWVVEPEGYALEEKND